MPQTMQRRFYKQIKDPKDLFSVAGSFHWDRSAGIIAGFTWLKSVCQNPVLPTIKNINLEALKKQNPMR